MASSCLGASVWGELASEKEQRELSTPPRGAQGRLQAVRELKAKALHGRLRALDPFRLQRLAKGGGPV